MVRKYLVPTPIKVSVKPTNYVSAKDKPNFPDRLVPFRLMVFDAPSYRLRAGWPVPPPLFDIHCESLVSANGAIMSYRPNPDDISTAAGVRWIADEDYIDPIDMSWAPAFTQGDALTWRSNSQFMPTLIEDYTYSINKERFTAKCMNFDHDLAKHMWAEFPVLNGSTGFTFIMVMAFSSIYNNTDDASYAGIISNGLPTPSDRIIFDENINKPFGVRLGRAGLQMVSGGGVSDGMKVANLIARTPPMYVALVLGRPKSIFYVGKGPKAITSTVLKTDSADSFDGSLVLGRSRGDILHCADMAIMDMGLYGSQLTDTQVQREFARLSSVYGADI